MKISTYVIFVAFLISFFHTKQAFAQRIYASQTETASSGICIGCQVLDAVNAVDGNPQTYSTLVLAVGVTGQISQTAIFPQTIPANTPVSLKLGTGDDLLSVQALGGVTFQAFNGTSPAGPAVGAAGLATALNNNNQTELTFSPALPYDRVRVNFSGGLVGALNQMYLYDVYYRSSGAVACNTPIDELHGISSALLGLGLGVGGVQNPALAIDGNPATASTLNAGVGALSAFAQQSGIFGAPSTTGDSVSIIFSTPQALVDAGVLSNFSVRTFNGPTDNNDSQSLNSALLNVRLLDLSNDRRRIRVSFVPQAVFDRVQIRLTSGIANVLSSIDLFEIQKTIPAPLISFNGSSVSDLTICEGEQISLSVTPQPNTVYTWYTSESGGRPVFTGSAYSFSPAASTVLYVQANRINCTDGSARTAVRITVNPAPLAPVLSNSTLSVPQGSTATISIASPQAGITYNWYTAPSGGTAIFSGTSFTSPALTTGSIYYVEAVNATGCSSNTRAQVNITVFAVPTISVSPPNANVNAGERATFTASSSNPTAIFNWYQTASGGSPIFTGPTFTSPAAYSNSIFYAEAVDPATNASSPRASATITVNGRPDVAVSPPSQTIPAGQSASFTASSGSAGVVFNWYTQPDGGSAIYTGPTFTTPALSSDATYYVESVIPATNTRSEQIPARVIIANAPDIAINPATQAVNPGQRATFTASSTNSNAVFNWYTDSTGTSPVFTGPTYTTPPVYANTSIYASATDPGSGAKSTRARAEITVNGDIQVGVSPPTQNINPGQSTSFTASSNVPGALFTWYNEANPTQPVFTGPSFTTPPLSGNTVYQVEASNPATNAVSARSRASVTVNGIPDIAVNPATRNVNAGQTASFTAYSTEPGTVFNWYVQATGGSPVFAGPNFTTAPVQTNTVYYAEAVNPSTGATSSRIPASVVLNNSPSIAVNPPSRAVNPGQTAGFTATSSSPGAVFNWYTEASFTEPVFTGSNFTTPPVFQNQTIYAEAIDPGTNARSPRVSASITINNAPGLSVNPPRQNVNAGDRASFNASSETPGAVFNWYTDSLSTNPVATGSTFITAPIFANTVIYTESVDPATNAISERVRSMVILNNIPVVTVSPPARNIQPGQTASFTAQSPTANAVFNWYGSAEGSDLIYSGTTFTSPPLNTNRTYYVEAVDPSSNARSARASASVTVNGLPGISIDPVSRTIDAGQSTGFTATSETPGAVINWYTEQNTQVPVFTGSTFTTPVLNTNTVYYAQAVDPSNNATSPLTAVNVYVNGMPVVSVAPPTRNINAGQTASFIASSTTAGAVFRWYDAPGSTTPIFTGEQFTSPALSANTRFYLEALNPANNAVSIRTSAEVLINSAPDLSIQPPAQSVAPGTSASFTARSSAPGSAFNWYSNPSATTPIFTGANFTSPTLTSSTTYYAQATDPATGARSDLKPASVVISGAPSVAVIPSVRNINERQTATFTATSPSAGAVFNWYTTPVAGTPVFTGPTFTSPSLSANTNFYVEAVLPASGATSERILAAVTVNPAPSLSVDPPQQEITAGTSAAVTASSNSPGAIFNWYTSSTGGSPIFTGPDFRTAPLSAPARYFTEAVDPITGASSVRLEVQIDISSDKALVFVPNAFSPNGDGNNDQLLTFGAELAAYEFRVYNQWGQLLYRNTDPTTGWDGTWKGTNQPVGVYVYYLSGTTLNDQKVEMKGTVTLIR